jgi:hypothetical protein
MIIIIEVGVFTCFNQEQLHLASCLANKAKFIA